MDIHHFTAQYLQALDDHFGGRVQFVGLQGSYGRGEATDNSDIDMVVVLDEVRGEDLLLYRQMLDQLPHRNKMCGFLSGHNELIHWDAADLFQLYHDTTPLRGTLDAALHLLDDRAVERAIKMGACNVFHGCVHNLLYGQDEGALRGLYKSAAFTVQAVVYRQTGVYYRRQRDALRAAQPREQQILSAAMDLKSGAAVDLDGMSRQLIAWCQYWIAETK